MRLILWFFQTAPQDLKTLLWILLGGSGGVIGYLYISKERQKEKDQERYDKLLSQFQNYKDKTSDERVELLEKSLTTFNTFKDAFEQIPDKIINKSVSSCQRNIERLIEKERGRN